MPPPNSGVQTATFEIFFVSSTEVNGDFGAQSEIVQQYIIRRLDEGVVNYNGEDLNKLYVEGAIPVIGDMYIDWDPSAVRGTWQGLARCRNVVFETIDKQGRCRATVTWSTFAATNPNTIVVLPSTIPSPNPIKNFLPASIEYSSSVRAVKLYRTGWTTNPPTVDGATYLPVDTTLADIGGTNARNPKEGIDSFCSQVNFKLRLMRDATVAPMAAQWTVIKDYIGKIHASTTSGSAVAAFFNFPAGTIICESVSMTKIEGTEYYEVVFNFLWDEFAFHDQVPELEAWGDVRMTGSPPTLFRVDWQRKKFTGVNFNNILSTEADLKAIIEKGYWT